MADSIKFELNKDAILKGVTTPLLQEWSGFFEYLRYQQYKKIRIATSEEDRIAIQQSVKGLDHVEFIFKQMIETKKFPLT